MATNRRLDFTRFTSTETVVIPIVNHIGRANGRLVKLPVDDGWYKLKVGPTIELEGPASMLDKEKVFEKVKTYRGYPVGEEIIPENFDNFFKQGYGESLRVCFLNEPPWEVSRFFRWEDGRFYSAGPDVRANRTSINAVKNAFEGDRPLSGVKGVTPELRYVFLLHSLRRDAFRAAQELERLKLAEEERQRRIEEFKATFEGRLQTSIQEAGGEFIRYYKQGRNHIVSWKIHGQQVTSTIKDDMGILDLGFCASGHDREHTLSSAILLAKDYYEQGGTSVARGGLHITRR